MGSITRGNHEIQLLDLLDFPRTIVFAMRESDRDRKKETVENEKKRDSLKKRRRKVKEGMKNCAQRSRELEKKRSLSIIFQVYEPSPSRPPLPPKVI